MRFLGASAALCCVLWSSCGSSDQGEARQYEISGTVLDARSGKGIQHAAVHFSSDTLDAADTDTDASGQFTLEVSVDQGVAFGTVVASHPSYQPAVSKTVYFDDLPHVVTLELQAKPASSK
jgi:hypothetical protein